MSPAPSPAAPARPRRKRDAKVTREALLRTAERIFVEKGFDGTRVDEIAERAGINKRMIYVYFGDKERLYLECLRTNFRTVIDASRGESGLPSDPRRHAEAAIRRYFKFIESNPGFVRLVTWEMLTDGRRAGQVLSEQATEGLRDLHDALGWGVRTGAFRADLDVRKLVASVYALCNGFFNQQSLLEVLWDEDLGTLQAREQMLDHIVRLVFDGIERRPEP